MQDRNKLVTLMILVLSLVVMFLLVKLFLLKTESGDNHISSVSECSRQENSEKKLQCFDDKFRIILKENGLSLAFNVLAELYREDAYFASRCHPITHTIGEAAYREFKEKKTFVLSPESNSCGFGFYHGFMEALFADGSDVEMAREVCDLMNRQYFKEGSQVASLACFHGIGHGVADGSAPNSWGDPQKFVKPALDLCDKIAYTKEEKYQCASGAFNSLSIAYKSGLYGMKINERDPLWICREQKKEYQLGCYTDMMVAIVNLVNYDIVKGAKYLKNVEDEYAQTAVRYISGLLVTERLADQDYSDIVSSCHKIEPRFREDCIGGFGSALMEFGEPGKNYLKALSFCELSGMEEGERGNCFKSVLGYANREYPKEKLKEICSLVQEKYWDNPCRQ